MQPFPLHLGDHRDSQTATPSPLRTARDYSSDINDVVAHVGVCVAANV